MLEERQKWGSIVEECVKRKRKKKWWLCLGGERARERAPFYRGPPGFAGWYFWSE
jgi:hypothetical protein